MKVEVPLRHVEANITAALREDIGTGDVSAALIPPSTTVKAKVLAREACVVCGQPWFNAVFAQLDPRVQIEWHCKEGDKVAPQTMLCTLQGPAQAILAGERAALNFLQMLSGVASRTRRFVERIKGTRARILDTRKTLPGLRVAQKYAVAVGGGQPHRLGLFDAVMIKENHIAALGGIPEAAKLARERSPDLPLIIEAETLGQVEQALLAGADVVLLDNFGTHLLARAVAMSTEFRRYNRSRALLEASGGISLENVREIADTGVDRISIGGLTKNVNAVDLSLRIIEQD
ncbi:MAG: carboxylating nicotinate-nucleotide diphosphorylase [Oceanococcaceae bacterium]